VKKEFFPIIDRDGKTKPILLIIIEEALSAGIEEIGIVIQERDRETFSQFFNGAPSPEYREKLSKDKQEYIEYLQEIGQKITWLTQEKQEGYGHAVYCAAEWVNQEPFLLLLGDHLYQSQINQSCAHQLLEIYQQYNGISAIGVRKTPGEEIHHYGCITGKFKDGNDLLELNQLYEKPSLDYAQKHLKIEELEENLFLSVFGMYILTPKIFDYLEEEIRENLRDKGEFQLTTCLEKLRKDEGMMGYIIKGKAFDTGLPETYRQTMIEYSL